MKSWKAGFFLSLVIAFAYLQHAEAGEWLFKYWTDICESEDTVDLIRSVFMMECVKNLTMEQNEEIAASHGKCMPDEGLVVEMENQNITLLELWCMANALEDEEEKTKMQEEIKSSVTDYYKCMLEEKAVPNFKEMTDEEKKKFKEMMKPIFEACKASWEEIEAALDSAK